MGFAVEEAANYYEDAILGSDDRSAKSVAYNNLVNIYGDVTYKSHSYAKATELLRQGIAQSPKNRDT